MVIRCLIAFALIAGVLLCGYVITRQAVLRFKHDAVLSDIVGRQRMLINMAELLLNDIIDATPEQR